MVEGLTKSNFLKCYTLQHWHFSCQFLYTALLYTTIGEKEKSAAIPFHSQQDTGA